MQRWFRRAWVATSLALLAWLMLTSHQTMLVVKTYAVISAFTCIAYTADKYAASVHRWRIPESTLHVFGLLGGWPGALFAQILFRHKLAKRHFQFVFWITVVFNLLMLGFLLSRWQLGLH